jgi:hypothetical protein
MPRNSRAIPITISTAKKISAGIATETEYQLRRPEPVLRCHQIDIAFPQSGVIEPQGT